jgi:hypothetical protein
LLLLPIPGPRPKYRDSGLGSQNEPRHRRVSCTFWNQQRPLFASNRRRKHHLGLGAKLDRRNYILLYRNRLRYGSTGKPEFKRSFLPRTGINTDPNSYSNSYPYSDTFSDAHLHSNADPYSYTHADPNSYSNTYTHADPNSYSYSDTHSDAHLHSNAHADPNSYSYTQSNTNPDPFSDN